MIRPRLGHFVYDEDECETMVQDILEFKSMGVEGVVFGTLTVDACVNVQQAFE